MVFHSIADYDFLFVVDSRHRFAVMNINDKPVFIGKNTIFLYIYNGKCVT